MSRHITEWSWGESNPRPPSRHRPRYDHSRDSDLRLSIYRVRAPPGLSPEPEVFPCPSVVFPTVHHYFCYRAVVVRPCVASRLAVFLLSPENQAARAKSVLLPSSMSPV